MSASLSRRTLLPLLAAAILAACTSDGFTPSSGDLFPPKSESFTITTPLGPTEVPEASMSALQVAPTAPAPASDVVSFYARKGEDRDVSIVFADPAGAPSFDGHGHDDNNGHHDHWNRGHGNGHDDGDQASDGNQGDQGGQAGQGDQGDDQSTQVDSTAGRGGDNAGAPLGAEYVRLTVWKNSLLAYPDGRPVADGDSVLITMRLVDRQHMLFEFEPAGLTFSAAHPAELRVNYGLAAGDLDHNGQTDAADHDLENHLGVWHQTVAGAVFDRLTSAVAKATQELRADLPGFSRYAVSY